MIWDHDCSDGLGENCWNVCDGDMIAYCMCACLFVCLLCTSMYVRVCRMCVYLMHVCRCTLYVCGGEGAGVCMSANLLLAYLFPFM